jgi:hypothetical protein
MGALDDDEGMVYKVIEAAGNEGKSIDPYANSSHD